MGIASKYTLTPRGSPHMIKFRMNEGDDIVEAALSVLSLLSPLNRQYVSFVVSYL